MFKDETPIATLLEQVQHFSNYQMDIIHSESDDFPDEDIIFVYEKALRLNDENALYCMLNKYDISYLYDGDDNLKIDPEKIDECFKDIFNMIKKVNPNMDYEKIRESQQKAEEKSIKFQRTYGGKFHQDCFIVDKEIEFDAKKFLEKLTTAQLIWLLRETNNLTYSKRREINKYKIRYILASDNLKDALVKFMKEETYKHPMPYKDICDIENEIIKIKI